MHPVAAIDHLLNFVLPALCLAIAVAAAGNVLMSKSPGAHGWRARVAINFLVGLVVLGLGLAVTGHDGRMVTWAALVLAVASSEWLQRRGWKG